MEGLCRRHGRIDRARLDYCFLRRVRWTSPVPMKRSACASPAVVARSMTGLSSGVCIPRCPTCEWHGDSCCRRWASCMSRMGNSILRCRTGSESHGFPVGSRPCAEQGYGRSVQTSPGNAANSVGCVLAQLLLSIPRRCQRRIRPLPRFHLLPSGFLCRIGLA